MVLGTLALAGMRGPLEEYAGAIDPGATSPWHAAQAASVLGSSTPKALWDLCVASLEERPFAPYLAMAARSRGDAAVLDRCARALVDCLRNGSVALNGIPETALTAVAVEALAPSRDRAARQAVARGRSFLLARQVLDVSASMHPKTLGAFCSTPIHKQLRCDVTAHAVLATAPR